MGIAKKKLHPEVVAYGLKFKPQYRAAIKAIQKFDKIVVFRHIKPDFDAFGSQLGLASFLRDNFPEKEIHVVGDNHVSFTPRLFPEMENLSENWFKENEFLAIICDVGDHERIADPRYKHAKVKIKFDHHPCKKEVAKPRYTICDLESASASEIVANFMLSFPNTFISKEAARHLYIGVVGDSGRFMYSSTSPHTFAIAESLLATGINITEIYQQMYEKNLDSLYSLAYVLANFKVSPHGVAYYCIDKETQERFHITPILGKEHVNTFANIAGINAWCSITEDPNPKDYCWRISIRSKKVDISEIAKKWGGGGHAQASGAKILNLGELDSFIADLDALFAE